MLKYKNIIMENSGEIVKNMIQIMKSDDNTIKNIVFRLFLFIFMSSQSLGNPIIKNEKTHTILRFKVFISGE